MSSIESVLTETTSPPDLVALKARQQAMWAAGDYTVVGTTLQIVGERLCEAVDLRAGERVLDVAAGNGNASLAAARRFADVTSTDYVAALLDAAGRRAAADGLALDLRVADAEELPFADAAFDVVLSTFGVMFTADHHAAARELLRVVRPGGRVGLANWTPEGFIGRLFATIGKHVSPPPGAKSPAVWGTQGWIDQEFATRALRITVTRQTFVFRYRSPEHWLEVFRTWYGPLLKAFAALDEAGKVALSRDILALIDAYNTSGDGTVVVPAEYLEIVIQRA
ncbi:class I SAM-dependent methyltransferase [Aurantimonas sp. HBX-1]|uniref:class I SAM-dependent methyltransferase n=1 Tax=Aurantimonas sp. HBX-1 TaxID=2906072 RepID=UPI001F3F055E|nr:class I SAM-dependent methyltransferase [Aurantimonas sp. HBX-1]UIJ70428.1 methyltransferase domain-containing protein [Aurantimonas sp. HBX-1]